MSTKIIRGRILSECIGFCGPTGFAIRAAINDKDGKDGANEQVFVCPRSESMLYVKVCQGMSRYVKVCQGMWVMSCVVCLAGLSFHFGELWQAIEMHWSLG